MVAVQHSAVGNLAAAGNPQITPSSSAAEEEAEEEARRQKQSLSAPPADARGAAVHPQQHG